MSDLGRVRAWLDEGRLVQPNRGPCTVHLARAIAAHTGAASPLDLHTREIAGRIGENDHLIVILADGFGMNLMDYLPEESVLRAKCKMQIDAVFPSSTAPALTSLATGQWPATHGLLFWWQYLPAADLSVNTLPFVERFTHQPLGELGVASGDLFACPPQAAHYSRDVLSLQPRRSTESVYTRYYAAGKPVSGYDSLDQAIDMIAARVAEARVPTYTYLYYSAIDRAEHDHGPDSPEARSALLGLDAEVSRLAEAIGGRARIVISADHGQFGVKDSAVRHIEEDDELLSLLRCVPTGEGPEPAFHVQPGRAADFEFAFRRRFGDAYALLSADEIDEIGLLGPRRLSSLASTVLGDYLALSAEPVVLRYRPESVRMPGDHGGLSHAEMEVPLIIV